MGESGGDPELENLLIEEMLDRQVDGVVYRDLAATRITLALGSRAPVRCSSTAWTWRRTRRRCCPTTEGGGRAAAGLLLDAGIRDGIYVVGEDPTTRWRSRDRGAWRRSSERLPRPAWS